MTDARSHPFTNVAASGRDEDILYLKWDLQRFLDEQSHDLLPATLLDQIARLIAQLAVYKHDRADSGDVGDHANARIVTLKATARAIQRALTDIAADDARRDGSVTLRKQLIRSDLTRTLARMTQVLSQLEDASPETLT